MWTPVQMVRVLLVALDEDVAAVTEEMGRRGVVQLSSFQELGGLAGRLAWPQAEDLRSLYAGFQRRISRLLRNLGLEAAPPAEEPVRIAPREVAGSLTGELTEIERFSGRIMRRQGELNEELSRLALVARQLELLAPLPIDLTRLRELEFLYLAAALVPQRNLERLRGSLAGVPHVLLEISRQDGYVLILAFAGREQQGVLEPALRSAYARDAEIPREFTGTPQQALAQLEAGRDELNREGERMAGFFQRSFEESGALETSVQFLNLAEDPPAERIVTPRLALTVAEYLAFDRGRHVLVILTDMTNYAEALREISSARGEVPARRGYPGYMYSDLASIYERCGRIEGLAGSITQMPILTMPNDDITHPVPDLTGYITEGQIVLSRGLMLGNIYPPVDVLPSLSRLMKDGIGAGHTRADHPALASQLYAAYAHVREVRSLASVVGEEELSPVDKKYLRFGQEFETRFVGQSSSENRNIVSTLNLGWEILSILPRSELTRVSREEVDTYYRERTLGI